MRVWQRQRHAGVDGNRNQGAFVSPSLCLSVSPSLCLSVSLCLSLSLSVSLCGCGCDCGCGCGCGCDCGCGCLCESVVVPVPHPHLCSCCALFRFFSLRQGHTPYCQNFMRACESLNKTSRIQALTDQTRRRVAHLAEYEANKRIRAVQRRQIMEDLEARDLTFAPQVRVCVCVCVFCCCCLRCRRWRRARLTCRVVASGCRSTGTPQKSGNAWPAKRSAKPRPPASTNC